MNIGINTTGFWPGKVGGVETYLRNLVLYLQRCDSNNRYTLLCDESIADEFPLGSTNFTIKLCSYRKSSFKKMFRSILMNTTGIDMLRAEPDYLDFDVVHHPFTTMKPAWQGMPSVLTFWDMQQEFYPNFFSPQELLNRQQTYKASAQLATRIIVSAEYTKLCLVDIYGIDPAKIDVIYTGFGPEYKLITDQEKLAKVKCLYGLDRPFIYYPAAGWPHKNHMTLLSALHLMINRYGFDGNLVLTGIAAQMQGGIIAEIERLNLGNVVKILGYLPYPDLPYLYTLARLMVFPSLFEGFGIPLVEAMACGCPLVCSNATTIPEVAGEAGIYFNPNSPEELAEKVWSAWSSNEKLIEMRRRGLERVKEFNWERTAYKTIEVYQKAAA